MIALVQRVLSAKVVVDGQSVGEIDKGLLVYLGVERDDDDTKARRLCERVATYRIFADEAGKMNLDVTECSSKVLVVSQFTLAADTKKGRRPSFSSAAHPAEAERLYQVFVDALKHKGLTVETGVFAADMKVHAVNDGPINFNLTV